MENRFNPVAILLKVNLLGILLLVNPLIIYGTEVYKHTWKAYLGSECKDCPKIIVFEFNSSHDKLTITYGDEKTKKPLSNSHFDYKVKYEIRDENGRIVFTHESSNTSLVLDLKSIKETGIYYLFIRPGRIGIMQYRILKK